MLRIAAQVGGRGAIQQRNRGSLVATLLVMTTPRCDGATRTEDWRNVCRALRAPAQAGTRRLIRPARRSEPSPKSEGLDARKSNWGPVVATLVVMTRGADGGVVTSAEGRHEKSNCRSARVMTTATLQERLHCAGGGGYN